MTQNNLPFGWKLSTLANIAKKAYGLIDGPFGSSLPASDYVGEGVPVIRGSNLSLGEVRFKDTEFVFVSYETAQRLSRSICVAEDIIFTKKGTLGQTAIVPKDYKFKLFLVSSNQMKLSVDPMKADPLYVYYYVSSPTSRKKIIQDAEVTGVPKTNLAYLRTFPITLPPLPEQRAIAHILGSLDDKIELNHQMNATLEAIARALFQSWFIDFDPVHAKANGQPPAAMDAETAALFPDSFEENESGLVPRGWTVGRFGDIADNVKRGINPENIDPNTAYIGLEHMPQKSIALDQWGIAKEVTSNKFAFKTGEFLFGKLRSYFHKVGVAPLDGVCSTDILTVTAKSSEWYGLVLGHISSTELVGFTTALSTGTRMPRTNWHDISKYSIVLPTQDVARMFDRHIQPIIEKIRLNIFESRTLTELRDTLLPKLMSGQLRVPEAEQFIGEQL